MQRIIREFLETNPSEEEIKLYDETTPLWIHPKTKVNINHIINQFKDLALSDIRIV